ncbi:hypothetical protein E5161_05865 [Cohnella pontilimi]|uniref:DUF2157 domain-containing protein n=1 Tax=Cohnella pontilimi TaxID=2564100 RepID=A0A4U0FF05_9BACL|nr:hypothetical protein [Cohnella pontilimi]TJY43411.1 hypothetical protein E5161_05865 [Cohnella pontilimi]
MPVAEEDKRKTIVNEIEAWRRSKLLPEQYCDFLQNLYLDDLSERPKGAVGAAVRKIGKASRKQWMLVFGIFALICVVVLHFSAFPLPLQIGLAGLVTTGFVGLAGWLRENHPLRALLVMVSGMLFLFGTGAVILQLHGWTKGAGPIVLLAVCSAMWIGCGLIIRQALVHGFGWMAVIALYARLLMMHNPHPAWGETQLFWIPAALLFIWLSWFLHVRNKSAGTVLFAVGLIVWLMPELHAAVAKVDMQWIQAGLLGKILLAGVGLYRLRKQWMEWVA